MALRINSRKGIEQPQVIIYVLFVVVLTISGIYIAFTQLSGVSLIFEFHDYASRLNTVSAKMMFTPECFAVETPLAKSENKYQVSGGVIDWDKFNKTKLIRSDCLPGENPVWARLQDLDTKVSDAIWSCQPPLTNCGEPTIEQLTDAKEWSQVTRSFFVQIKNGTSVDKGVLTVRLKD